MSFCSFKISYKLKTYYCILLKWRPQVDQHEKYGKIKERLINLSSCAFPRDYLCDGGIEKSIPPDHRLHHSTILVMPIGDLPGGLFYPTLIMHSYLLLSCPLYNFVFK